MKKLAKVAALIIGFGGAVGLGYLISIITNSSFDTATGIILVLITLFAGGALILGIFIYLFLYANDDLKAKPLDSSSKSNFTNNDSTIE